MTPLESLWLPILLSSVFVFIASAIVNMASPWHKKDFPKHPQQDAILNALRPFSIPPGEYLFPRATDSKDRNSPEYNEQQKTGPVFIMTAWKYGSTPMGMTFVYWFINVVIVGVFAAYIAGRALPVGASYPEVFRFAGTTAFLSYVMAVWQFSIWYSRPWKSALKSTLDGLIYALLTAGTFGWLWPQ